MIPIRNLYLMLCYAWNRLDRSGDVETGSMELENCENLLALMLADGVASLLKHGLLKRYMERTEESSTLRGRLNLADSLKRMLLDRGMAQCTSDDLSDNTLHNQIIKTTVDRLLRCDSVDIKIRKRLLTLRPKLAGISLIALDHYTFSTARRTCPSSMYSLTLEVCRLAFDCLVPEPGGKGYRAVDFFRDEKKMWRVFQDFVLNYYKIEAKHYTVTSAHIKWDIKNEGELYLLPTMRTDVTLQNEKRYLILDTKYTASLFKQHFKKSSFRTEHLYQILTYVDQQAGHNALEGRPVPEGILLYPAASHHIDATYEIKGRRLRIATIDLTTPWQQIKESLDGLID